MQPATAGQVLRFGIFELDLNKGQLRKAGVRLKLRPQAFHLLTLLASRSGDLVTREEIQKVIWSGDVVVDVDQGLNFCIRQIRNALADNADAPRFIETVPRRGYRFLVPIETLDPVPAARSSPPAEVAPRVAAAPAPRHGPPRPIDRLIAGSPMRGSGFFVAAGLTVFALLVLFSLTGSRRRREQPAGGTKIRAIAVLPLANLSGDINQEFFADGMTEALIGRLSTLRDVRVVSRTSVMQFKQSRKPVPAIARELNVDAVVEGAVLRSAERVRISVRLIRGGTEEKVWSNVYERKINDVLGLQSELALAITRQIEGRLAGGLTAFPAASRSVAREVYESYLKGRFQLNRRDRAAVEESIRHFERAIAGDPGFAPAFSALGNAYIELATAFTAGSPVSDSWQKAAAAARKALELDPASSEGHTVLAAALERNWEWDEAEKGHRRALDLDPNNPLALDNLGALLVIRGRPEEGIELTRHARTIDCLNLRRFSRLGWLLYQARRYDEAARELRTALTIDPNHRESRWFLGFVLVEQQRYEEAIQTLEQASSRPERISAELGILAAAYARAGQPAEALRIVGELMRRRRERYVPPAPFVMAYAGLADYEKDVGLAGARLRRTRDINRFPANPPRLRSGA
jgi:TolB-like protein/DNA-binding winged helix-turn-helix (wHTH) protein/Tfp pilus assembly protein PilF